MKMDVNRYALQHITNEYELAAHILTKAKEVHNHYYFAKKFNKEACEPRVSEAMKTYLTNLGMDQHNINMDEAKSRSVRETFSKEDNLTKLAQLAGNIEMPP
jgi:hypothetical protein